jgi:hypothetical protein
MAVAVDWLDAYRAARINQIVGMHSPDAVIECACGGRKVIHGQGGIGDIASLKCLRSNWKTCRRMATSWLSPIEPATGPFRRCWTLRKMG